VKVAVIYNKSEIKDSDVINVFGMRTMEWYSKDIVEQVASSLEQGGHNVRIIEGNMHVIDELENFMPRVVRGEIPGMVFNMAYGIQGQSRYTHIPSMLEMLGVPYIGSGPAAHAIALDKVMSKIVFQSRDLPTPVFQMYSNPDEEITGVDYPVIVKPRMEAVSFGIRLVDNEKDLREAISTVTREFQQQALVEKFIPGREFAVSLLGNEPTLGILPIVEIDLDGDPNSLQTTQNKRQIPFRKICPAQIPQEIAEELSTYARGAFNALGLYDFARVDFRMDPENRIQILEINSMASLNKSGSFVKAAEANGWSFAELINRILDSASVRYFGSSCLREQNGQENAKRGADLLHIRIRRYLRSHLPTIIESIQHMVSINSYVHDVEGVNALGEWVSNRIEQLGFQRQVYPQMDMGDMLYFKNHDEGQNDVLLLGHLDPPLDYTNHVPFSEDHGKILGSGVTESKSGLAIIIAGLQALRFTRVLRTMKCGILLTSDHTLSGQFSREILFDIAGNSRHVIGTEHGELGGGVVTSCSGMLQYQVEVTNTKDGRTKKTANVIEHLSQKNLAWLKLSSPQKGIRVKIDNLTAQMNPGNASDHAIVFLSVCYSDKSQSDRMDDQIRKIAEKGSGRGLQVRIRAGERRFPMVSTGINHKFFEKVKKLAKLLEVRIEPTHRDTFSSICHVPDGVPVLGGFGPLGSGSGSSQEFIMRDSLIDRAALLALVTYDCCRSENSVPAKSSRSRKA